MLHRLFGKRSRAGSPAAERRPRAPSDCRVYAIGDIHGRLDLLQALHEQIAADCRARPHEGSDTIVYLGDYVDRGPSSREVIDCLLDAPLPGFAAIHLMGNHEEAMLRFLDDVEAGPAWVSFGGEATLLSYGVRRTPNTLGRQRFEDMRRQFAAKIPERHVGFLRGLRLSYESGDYFFAHAGVRPGVAISAQQPQDLLWIRNAFLSSDVDHGKVVVHGHTPTDAPEIRHNRIGIDTCAFASGVLTCLVLEGDDRRFLATGSADWSQHVAAQ
ncbi:metallophosphoesterase family protein [Reyranella sp. CPCC 100927]|uniref:metallophosphoesterase family protein n=1 Tax=Reyranella sp. CPCC 100927 TaxID=2599616 RepID=UPI0011B7E2E8|nr:metallophosphoesterase family protein [Reyranella sp. CPCC 100927]TWT12984.1 serine/threonine protein phosphatase [Reyranella sp. CPCC 100927]